MKENAAKGALEKGKSYSALAGLLEEDFTSTGDALVVDNAWRGAEVRKVKTRFQKIPNVSY